MAITRRKLAFEDDVITKALLTAKGDIIHATASGVPAVLAIGADNQMLRVATDILNYEDVPAAGAHKDSHDPNDGSDPLDTAAAAEISVVVAAGAGTAHEFAAADHIHAINHAITDNHLVTIDGADIADDEIARFTADGLESRTPAEVAATMALDDIGVPDAAVDFDLQEATDLVVMTVANEAALPAANVAIGQLCWATGELSLHVCTVAA